MRRPLDWLREHPPAADAILAAVITGLGLVGLALADRAPGTHDPNVLTAAVVVVQGGCVAWRRRAPIAVLVVAVASSLAVWAADWPDVATGVAPFVAVYSVGAHSPARAGRAAAAGAGGVLLGAWVLGVTDGGERDLTFDALVGTFALFVTAYVLGEMMRARRDRLEALEERAAAAESSRADAAQRAVAAERARIARELHDVVAHSVSVMVVQAGAARRVLGRDPDAALQAIGSVEDIGRQSITELRRMLGVLRGEDDRPVGLAPQPGVAGLESLVESTREAGVPVDLTVEGLPRPLPPGVDLSAYRIVQEALTNVLKHAGPAAAHVRLRYGAQDLSLEVVDDGRGAAALLSADGSGHGLVGMRERVSLFGGELSVGNRQGGGYSVRARLPLPAA